jgi:hypothetical protein
MYNTRSAEVASISVILSDSGYLRIKTNIVSIMSALLVDESVSFAQLLYCFYLKSFFFSDEKPEIIPHLCDCLTSVFLLFSSSGTERKGNHI